MLSLNEFHGKNFSAYNGDCCEVMRQLPECSIDHAIFSPPFGDLFVYSDSVSDLGNSGSAHEFMEHYAFFAKELTRVMKPGRMVAVHCSDLPTRKWKDGYIGCHDFSGELIRAHQVAGLIFYRRVTIWKDPVVEMTRTNAINLLYRQLCKDSTVSAPGLPDYLLIFKRPGENPNPVEQNPKDFPLSQWQEWASPVWTTINQTNVLNISAQRKARESEDERHVCPLQLDVIRRSLTMWSNHGDVVLSPFMGIGSEGDVSLREGRKFVGIELKESYWRQSCAHLSSIEDQSGLFSAV